MIYYDLSNSLMMLTLLIPLFCVVKILDNLHVVTQKQIFLNVPRAECKILCKSPQRPFQGANNHHTKVTGRRHWCTFILLPQPVSLYSAPYCERRGVGCPVALVANERSQHGPSHGSYTGRCKNVWFVSCFSPPLGFGPPDNPVHETRGRCPMLVHPSSSLV